VNKENVQNSNLITIMVPTYNRLDKLRKCVKSIFSQTCSDFDLVISDNASTDGTREYLRSSVHWPNMSIHFSETNDGSIRNHEKCIEMSETEWVVFVSDDDWIVPEFVSKVLRVVRSSKSSVVLPGFSCRNVKGKTIYSYCPEERFYGPQQTLLEMFLRAEDQRICCAGIAGFIVRKKDLVNLLPMRSYPGFFYFDTYLFFCMSMISGIQTIDEILYFRTEWEGSTTKANSNLRNQRIARKYFISDFRSHFLTQSTSWDPVDRDIVLNALRSYERKTPFTIRRRLGRVGMVRSFLDLDLIKRSRKKLKMITW